MHARTLIVLLLALALGTATLSAPLLAAEPQGLRQAELAITGMT